MENIWHKKLKFKNIYNRHKQIEGQLSSLELSIKEKGPKQQLVEIRPSPFYNIDNIKAQLDITGTFSVALQTTPPLNSVVYPI